MDKDQKKCVQTIFWYKRHYILSKLSLSSDSTYSTVQTIRAVTFKIIIIKQFTLLSASYISIYCLYPQHTKYVEGYIVFIFPSVRPSVRPSVHRCICLVLNFTSKFCVKFFLYFKKWRWPGVSMPHWVSVQF